MKPETFTRPFALALILLWLSCSALFATVARGATALPALLLEVIRHDGPETRLEFWVSTNASFAKQSFSVTFDKGNLLNLRLTALPTDNSAPLQLSKVSVLCLDQSCENFDASLIGTDQQPKSQFKMTSQKRFVEVHTSLDVNKTWLSQVDIDILSGDNDTRTRYRVRQRDDRNQTVFDIEGPLTQEEGVCIGATLYQPWRGQVQACLAGVGADGSLLIRIRPVVVILNPTIPFGLPMADINNATRAKTEVAIWLKILPPNYALPVEKPKKAPHVTSSAVSNQIFDEIEEAVEVDLVTDRISNIWAKKQRPRLGTFLRMIKTPAIANKIKSCQARAMLAVLSQHGLPQVTSLVTLIESDFSPTELSDKQALGFWQFIPQTALEYGLKLAPVDERTLVGPSTEAASRYLVNSMAHYAGPNAYKFALASYNSGVRRIDLQLQNLPYKQTPKKKISKRRDDTILEFQDLVSASKNFWDLYTYGLLYAETQAYVLDIMAASYLALHPDNVGLDAALALDSQTPLTKLSCPKK